MQERSILQVRRPANAAELTSQCVAFALCHATQEVGCRNVDRLQRRHGQVSLLPKFFILPHSWEDFMQYIKHNPNRMWIRKPLASSRGRGIRLLSKPLKVSPTCNKCIIQEYVQKPLCVHGYKFDVRIYMAVTSFHPMRAYLFQNGVFLPCLQS